MFKRANYIVLVYLLICISLKCIGQGISNLGLYQFKNVAQCVMLNPAAIPENDTTYSIFPSVSAVYYNPGFTFIDLFKEGTNSQETIDRMLADKTIDFGRINLSVRSDILFFGIKSNQKYFSFGYSLATDGLLNLSKDFIRLMYDGNATVMDFSGRFAKLSGIGIDISEYSYLHFGVSEPINQNMTIGYRFKLLMGLANISTSKANISLITGGDGATNPYRLHAAADYKVNTSGDIFDNTYGLASLMANPNGLGLGFDAGVSYKMPKNNLVLSASLLDAGFIYWHQNARSYYANSTFNFEGLGYDFGSSADSLNNLFVHLKDSLFELFKPEEKLENYATFLNFKLYLGVEWKIQKNKTIGATILLQAMRRTLYPAFNLSYTQKIHNGLDVRVGWTAYHKTFENINVGFALNMGAVQWYANTDNIIGLMNYQTLKFSTFSMGLNLNISRNKDWDYDGIPDKMDRCKKIAGIEIFKGCPDFDNDLIPDIDDACPDLKGVSSAQGCPDKDADGIQDREDKCPRLAGEISAKGCPDADRDSIPDHKDECPDVFGTKKTKGCPDRDQDGVPDKDDKCPEVAGLKSNGGCKPESSEIQKPVKKL
ncbi:MAG: DUF5723 family protein [Bacteroidota bacterium]|nr:DUF5723 family protein [Bacteroidota bacterium]